LSIYDHINWHLGPSAVSMTGENPIFPQFDNISLPTIGRNFMNICSHIQVALIITEAMSSNGETPGAPDAGKLQNPFAKDRDGFLSFSSSTPQPPSRGNEAGGARGRFMPRRGKMNRCRLYETLFLVIDFVKNYCLTHPKYFRLLTTYLFTKINFYLP
jgi:hypothetical protein